MFGNNAPTHTNIWLQTMPPLHTCTSASMPSSMGERNGAALELEAWDEPTAVLCGSGCRTHRASNTDGTSATEVLCGGGTSDTTQSACTNSISQLTHTYHTHCTQDTDACRIVIAVCTITCSHGGRLNDPSAQQQPRNSTNKTAPVYRNRKQGRTPHDTTNNRQNIHAMFLFCLAVAEGSTAKNIALQMKLYRDRGVRRNSVLKTCACEHACVFFV